MVTILRAEGPKVPSPEHRPGYDSNQQDAMLGQKLCKLKNVNLPYSYMQEMKISSF